MACSAGHLVDGWRLGEPWQVGALTLFPVLGGGPGLELVPFARALAQGAEARELPEGASVNDILVDNPTGAKLLLLDGEAVEGAQQNRVFDGSMVVPPRSRVKVPVCCVEQGRWDGRAHHRPFRSAGHVAHPELRSTMAVLRSVSTGRTDQDGVWSHVASRVRDSGTSSSTVALDDVYRSREDELDALVEGVPSCPGQRGMLVLEGDALVALDWVASEEAWADLHPRFVRGYAMDALERPNAARPASRAQAERHLAHLRSLPLDEGHPRGAARSLGATHTGGPRPVHVSALAVDGHLAHFAALAA
ncbi:MAG: ARPP-1 family domain-containing protein [Myxococcota bacterium]